MTDADVLATRLLKLTEALGHLEGHGEITTARLTGDPVLRAAVERWPR